MKNYLSYILATSASLAAKLVTVYLLTDLLRLNYYAAYFLCTASFAFLNFNLINLFVFPTAKTTRYKTRLLQFSYMTGLSALTNWFIASAIYFLTAQWLVATIAAGAITTTANFLISKNKIWKHQAPSLKI